jgi:hypothetical protein
MDSRLGGGGNGRRRMRAVALCSLLLAAPIAGCRDAAPDRPAAARATAAGAEWGWLLRTQRTLDERRARLGSRPQPGADAETWRRERRAVDDLAAEFDRRLVELINADPPTLGQPLSPRQLQAIRLKSDEDLRLARDFIERGGDYRRALEIYEAALAVDPDNPSLKAELERARAARYMTAVRFAQVKKGMRADEVRALLGQPNLHNVRAFKDGSVVGWFYPKDASGAAAAVWFERKGDGLEVYNADFAAVSPPGAGAPAPAAPAKRALAPASAGAGG